MIVLCFYLMLYFIVKVPDTRLDCAILRPMESDGDHFLAYYLPKEDEIADDFKRRRREDNDQEVR